MTGLDSNVLIRYLVEDDEEQSTRVHRFLSVSRMSAEVMYVSCIVLCEVAWVLRTTYGWAKPKLLSHVEAVLDAEIFRVEEEAAVRRAVEMAKTGKADFPIILSANSTWTAVAALP